MTVAFAIGSGCTCRGKGPDEAGAAAQSIVAEPGAEAPAADPIVVANDSPKAYEKGRFDVQRTGFIKATLDGRAIAFEILPATQNRVSFGTKPPLVLVDGYASEGGKEHLRVHIQGVPVAAWQKRSLVQTEDRSWVVAITYQDADGKTFAGRVGRDEGVTVEIGEVDPPKQLVTGSFSGPLREVDGTAVIEIAGGSFTTARKD